MAVDNLPGDPGPRSDRSRFRRSGTTAAGRLRCALRRFTDDERGSAAIEFVLWVPGFAFLLMLFTDTSLYFLTRSDMSSAIREAARMVTVGELQRDDVASHIEQTMSRGGDYTVAVTGTTDVIIDLSLPVAAATLFGIIEVIGSETIEMRVEMRIEVDSTTLGTGGTS